MENKSFDEFYRDKSKSDGYKTTCKVCRKLANKVSYEKNKTDVLKKTEEYRKKNVDRIKEYQKKYYNDNKNELKDYHKKYRETNKENKKERDKNYYKKNRELILKKYFDNRENEINRMRLWKKNNREKLAEYQRNYYKERKGNDLLFKLTINIRALIQVTIKRQGYSKKSKTYQILGCSFEDFKFYIESKWESWMNWDNYGLYNGTPNYGWDIDHIIPMASALNESEVIQLNHFTNLQPLCSYINRDIKKDNIN
jgi:hypothetical protein